VWNGFDSNIRSDIRKAEKSLEVRTELPMRSFLNVYEKTFHRQHLKLPLQREFYFRLDDVLERHDQRRAFFAVDSKEQIHAVAYVVWDDERAYYLMGGADPHLRSSGASSLLLWKAIQFSATVAYSFDFEGSMLETIERFFRAFGGVQTPYYVATRARSRLAKIGSILLRGAA